MKQQRSFLLAPFIVLAVVMGSFVGSVLYVEHYTRRLSAAPLSLSGSTDPLLEPLTDMRSQLHRIMMLTRPEPGFPWTRQRLEAVHDAQRQFIEAYNTYAQATRRPGPGLFGSELGPAAERFHHISQVFAAEAADSPVGQPSRPVMDEFQDSAETVTQVLMRETSVVVRDSDEARAALADARIRSTKLAHTLYAVCALAGLVGGVLAAWAVRRYARLSSQFAELQAHRAAELEQFSGRVAHDILGPLQPASMGLELLARKLPDEPEVKELLARVRRSLGRVRLIVDGLLRFARAGAHPDGGEHASLWHVMEGLRDDLVPFAEDAGVSLRIESAPDVHVACSEAAALVVLQNLIRNAIKYIGDGPRKQVVARASVQSRAVHLVVEDSGPGLLPGTERTIFEPYVRATRGNQPGIGLGLATVKRIVEAHGGRVGVQSSPGQGAAFWVDLPLAA